MTASVPPLQLVHVMGWRSQQYGSFERFLVALSERWVELGHEAHFVFPATPASDAFLADAPARFHVIESPRGPLDPRFALRLKRLFTEVGATHLHAHFGVDAYHALAIPGLRGLPRRFASKHITPSDSLASRSRHRWLGRRVEVLFAVSEQVTWRLIELGVPPAKVVTCQLGVDPHAYRPAPEARRSVREELGISSETRVILSTSHLRTGKGVELLPELAARLTGDHDAIVLLCGDGPLRPVLERRAHELGLDEHFRLLGVRQDVPQLLASADLFVFPTSGNEGLPLGVLEALSSATPVVATAVSDLRELAGDVATLVPAGDPQAFLAACEDILDNPRPAFDRAMRARALIERSFSHTRAADQYLERYLAEDSAGRSRLGYGRVS